MRLQVDPHLESIGGGDAEMSATRMLSMAGLAITLTCPVLAKPPATLITLYSFKGNPNDGLNPDAKLLYHDGFLYGTTSAGGTNDYGTVFKVDPTTGAESVLYALPPNVGSDPRAGLISLKGQLYGTAEQGGGAFGSVVTVNPATGEGSAIHHFGGPPDGAFPDGELLSIKNELYGGTQLGGSQTFDGAIYEIDTASGAETILYNFLGEPDGASPVGVPINESNRLFGVTQSGGTANVGTVFKINVDTGVEKVIYSFKGGTDGEYPDAGVVAKGDALYGTTYSGGASGYGTVFKVGRDTGAETILYSFTGGPDGASPSSSLLLSHGALYGTTYLGGLGYGTVFSIDLKSGTETVLYSFTGGDDGAYPAAGLIEVSGVFYGTTQSGGTSGDGTVFKIDP